MSNPDQTAEKAPLPLIVQYTDLLHANQNDPKAKPVLAFRKAHSTDAVFLGRADTLDMLTALKRDKDSGPSI